MSGFLGPAVVFRRRSGWEASDLGVFLWRKNWLPIILFMGIPSAFLGFLYAAAAGSELEWLPQIAALFMWWLKPLLDRFGLQVISVRFFEPHSSLRALFKNLGKTLRTGLLGDLLWRRFSLYRSARMPLLVLERLKGKSYKRRKLLLARNGLGFGLPLTLITLGMALALHFGELLFLQSIFSSFSHTYQSFFEFIGSETLLVSVVWYCNMVLMETLYVAMGFSLYINSRVETEGWDIELHFKTCVEKAERKYHRKSAAFVPVLALIFIFSAKPAWTQQAEQSAATQTAGKQHISTETLKPAPVSEDAAKTLEQILEAPEFGVQKPGKKIQLKKPGAPKNQSNNGMGLSFPALREILGVVLRFILGAALIAALGTGIYFAYRYKKRLFPLRGGEKSRVDGVVLPDDPHTLLQKAEELYRNGKEREAWAICFKAFTGIFTRHWFLPIPPEATEYETVALLRKKTGAHGAVELSGSEDCAADITGFEQFVRRWIIFAYGGREPEAGNFAEALASCRALMENGANA